MLRALIQEVRADDVFGISAELAYRFLFALFPFFLFLAALSSFVARWMGNEDPTSQIIQGIGTAVPGEAPGMLETELRAIFENRNGGLLSVGAIVALWAASTATKSVMKAMNRAYNVEESRSFLQRQVLALGLSVLAGAAFLVAAVLLLAGPLVVEGLSSAAGLGDEGALLVNVARIPFVLLLLFLAVVFIYRVKPAVRIPFRWLSPGALAFVVVWVVATIGFSLYLANFANYGATYGSLGGVIILLTWFYITAFVMVLGGELNAVIHRRATNNGVRRHEL